MRTIKASELGAFSYCQRAWWYQQHGEVSRNSAALEVGTAHHVDHAIGVKSTILLKWLALALFLVGLGLVLVGLG